MRWHDDVFYLRLFGGRKQCAKCCETLQPDELVMRGREHLFHTRCFSCHVCQTHLIKGSTFGMVGALIFCQQHYQQGSAQFNNNNNQPFASSQQQPPVEGYMGHHQEPFGSPVHPFDHHVHHHHQHYGQLMAHQPSTNLLVEPMIESNKLYHHQSSPASVSPASSLKNQRVRTKRRMQPSIKSSSSDMQVSLMNEREDDSFMSVDGGGLMDTSSSSPCSSMLMGSMGGANGVHNPHQQQQQGSIQQQQKTKRLRTSFKHHQLRMLKSYFATNHNPDAKDLKQLSQKTTLSKRVLQVKIFSAFKNILLYSYLVRIFFFSLLLLVTKKKTTTKTRIRETIAHHAKRIFLGDSLQLCGHRRRKLQVIAMRGSNRFFWVF